VEQVPNTSFWRCHCEGGGTQPIPGVFTRRQYALDAAAIYEQE